MLEEGVVVPLEEDSMVMVMVMVMVLEQSEGRECTRTTLMCGPEKEIGTAQIQRVAT